MLTHEAKQEITVWGLCSGVISTVVLKHAAVSPSSPYRCATCELDTGHRSPHIGAPPRMNRIRACPRAGTWHSSSNLSLKPWSMPSKPVQKQMRCSAVSCSWEPQTRQVRCGRWVAAAPARPACCDRYRWNLSWHQAYSAMTWHPSPASSCTLQRPPSMPATYSRCRAPSRPLAPISVVLAPPAVVRSLVDAAATPLLPLTDLPAQTAGLAPLTPFTPQSPPAMSAPQPRLRAPAAPLRRAGQLEPSLATELPWRVQRH